GGLVARAHTELGEGRGEWLFTVLSARKRRAAISLFVQPITTSPRICFSRAESTGGSTCRQPRGGTQTCPARTACRQGPSAPSASPASTTPTAPASSAARRSRSEIERHTSTARAPGHSAVMPQTSCESAAPAGRAQDDELRRAL